MWISVHTMNPCIVLRADACIAIASAASTSDLSSRRLIPTLLRSLPSFLAAQEAVPRQLWDGICVPNPAFCGYSVSLSSGGARCVSQLLVCFSGCHWKTHGCSLSLPLSLVPPQMASACALYGPALCRRLCPRSNLYVSCWAVTCSLV